MRVATIAIGLLLSCDQGGLDPRLADQLQRRGTVAVLGSLDALPPLEGTTWVPEDRLGTDLSHADSKTLLDSMESAGVDALLVEAGSRVEAEDVPLRQRLAAYQPVNGLQAIYLAPSHALYTRAVSADLGRSAEVLPRIARTILEGQTPPRISRFPEPLRRIRNVEVMVLLRDRGRARLWRSARGSSVARALVTATVVARQRWEERESALGGPLDVRLPFLDVEVSLLEEDGTLGATSPSFVERVFYDGHGVAYERPGAWRYQLPDATEREGEGSAVRAYEALFSDNALPADSFRRPDLRFYRLVATDLGASPAPALRESDNGLGADSLFDAVDGDPAGS